MELGNNNVVNVSRCGTVDITLVVHKKETKCGRSNVLHVSDRGYQLLSVTTPYKTGLKVSFFSGKRHIKKFGNLLATRSMVGNLNRLDPLPSVNTRVLVSEHMELWHRRLVHVNPSIIAEMSNKKVVDGLDEIQNKDYFQCPDCITEKGHRTPIPKKSSTYTSQRLELVPSDVCGPLEAPSIGGSRYFVTFIDDFS